LEEIFQVIRIRKKFIIWAIIVVVSVAAEGVALYVLGSNEPFVGRFEDEPKGHALYEKMIETMRQAESLSYTSKCSNPEKSWKLHRNVGGTYNVWMKKPNYFRVEAIDSDGVPRGTIVGNGDYLWIFWNEGRPFFNDIEERNTYEKTRSNVYMRKAIPIEGYSIGHEIVLLGAKVSAIIDPAIFNGYTDSLEPYLDGVRYRGSDKIGDQECDVIEVSFMKRQRTWYMWLSEQDCLPRKMKEIVRATKDYIGVERWFDVTINAEIPDEKFAWSPPEGWRQWEMPKPEDKLLKAGTPAPDFNLAAADGGKIRLSDYRGKIVWLYIWQAGEPACREEMSGLQELYGKYKDQDMVIVGFNCWDDKQIALDFIRENSATFANVLDSSYATRKLVFDGYNNRSQEVPLSYIIDREGKVADAWFGYEKGHKRAIAALEKLGVTMEGE
jgi:peroxiredoxin/outer membrane lipoprotein-sorting protein